jgi:HPt (histidine-containing phosphotransfer) domain-containing protein
MARLAHQLAGASSNIHAAPLRQMCLDLESSLPAAGTAQLEAAVAGIGDELARVCEVLREAPRPAAGSMQDAS